VDTVNTMIMTNQGWERMKAHVDAVAPEEACGLVAGHVEGDFCREKAVFALTNILHSPVGYRIAPMEQLEVFNQIDAQGWELIGIYHSHPNGPGHPSPTDVAEAYYPDAIYLIWSRDVGEWQCRGYRIHRGVINEVVLTR
jgi:proteasome lid subunit RPN8/RPN11